MNATLEGMAQVLFKSWFVDIDPVLDDTLVAGNPIPDEHTLKALTIKYDFVYPEEQLLTLPKKVKVIVDDKANYTDWSLLSDIQAELKVDLIILLDENGYPPIDRDEVYKEIFEQTENLKKYQAKQFKIPKHDFVC